jgi:hypothetical protein
MSETHVPILLIGMILIVWAISLANALENDGNDYSNDDSKLTRVELAATIIDAFKENTKE